MSEGDAPAPEPNRLAELRASARGWHGVQLAVLGFIGLCGVLQGDSSNPMWLQVLSGLLALSALVLACAATYLVGRAAWPLYGAQSDARPAGGTAELAEAGRQVKLGLKLTFIAVALLALATASSWWPEEEGAGGLVEVQGADGRSLCGRLAEGRSGTLSLEIDGRSVAVAIDGIASVRPVSSCG
jgi:hypothetical protein